MILYKKDKKGVMRYWEVEVDGDELIKRHGKLGGEETEHSEIVNGNARRDSDEQALFKMESEITKRLKKGYCYTIEDAENANPRLNFNGFYLPMLAAKFEDANYVDPADCDIQYKYNGHRCLITNRHGKMISYSKTGEIIDTVPEILSQLNIPDGATVDGELYIHGEHLQTISSYVKKKQDGTDLLTFMMYDVITNDSFDKRLQLLRSLNTGNRIILADEVSYSGDILADLESAKGIGYEGLMLRQRGVGYEHFRTKNLLKVKSCFDDECMVVDINPSKDGWAILTCMFNGKSFTASAPGTVDEKTNVLVKKHDFIGRKVTIEYAELTKDGAPSHGVATQWRGEE